MAARVCCMNKVRLGSKPMVCRFLTFAHLIACLIIFFQPISYFVLNCYRYSQHCGGLGMLVVNMAALGGDGVGVVLSLRLGRHCIQPPVGATLLCKGVPTGLQVVMRWILLSPTLLSTLWTSTQKLPRLTNFARHLS